MCIFAFLEQHRSARGVHHTAFCAENRVEQRGFADVRIANEHDASVRAIR